MRRLTISVAAALSMAVLISGSAFAQLPPTDWVPAGSPVASYGRLKVNGTKLQSADGTTVQLRGMSFFWSSDTEYAYRFYNERVVSWLVSDWHVSVVRAALGITGDGVPYMTDKNRNKSLVNTVVKAAIEQGIYVIIDWHSHSAENEKAAAIEFFKEMAAMYKDYPNVIYEIYNEPIGTSWSTIKSYANDVIDAIRAIDANNIIIVGTRNYSQQIGEPANDPITGANRANIMYVMHFYCDHSDGTQIPYSTNVGKIPIFVSEFGYSRSDGNGGCGSHTNVNKWLDDLDKNNTSWVAWSITNKDETSAAIKHYPPSNAVEHERLARGGWSDNDLTDLGKEARRRLRTYSTVDRKYNAAFTAVGNGTIQGAGTYASCAEATLTARPGDGQRFEGWVITGPSSGTILTNPYKIEMCSDKTGTAVFFIENLLKNSTFTQGTTSWTVTQGPGATGSLAVVDSEGKVTVATANASNNRNLRLQQTGVALENGKRYKLSFKARSASGTRSVTPTVVNSSGVNFMGDTTAVQLTTTMTPFNRTFDMTAATTTAAVVAFYCGSALGDWFIDDISLELVGQGTGTASPAARAASPFRAVFTGRALTFGGGTGGTVEVRVYDMSGRVRLARSVSLSGAAASVPLDRLPSGVYSVRYSVDGRAAQGVGRVMLTK